MTRAFKDENLGVYLSDFYKLVDLLDFELLELWWFASLIFLYHILQEGNAQYIKSLNNKSRLHKKKL